MAAWISSRRSNWLKPTISSFQASSSSTNTVAATGVKIQPMPTMMPLKQVTISATEVVSSAPAPRMIAWVLVTTMITPVSSSVISP